MQTIGFPSTDQLGPQQIVFACDPAADLMAVVVIDNVAAGPAIGGTRMAADISVDEIARLARAMTLKNAAAGLPHGGAKAGIRADPHAPRDERIRLVRAFGAAIRDLHDYIPGPDMGMDEALMAHVRDTCGRAVGLPAVLGGIPLDQVGATGFGLAVAAQAAADMGVLGLTGARVVVQGFGAVGYHVARFLAERGAIAVAVADSGGAVVDPSGLDIEMLHRHKGSGGSVVTCPGTTRLPAAELAGVDCDIWIPAARPDVLTEDNAYDVKARLVLQGANIPATPAAERILHDRGIVVVPDFIANAGGVICAAVEHARGTRTQAFAEIAERIDANTRQVLTASRRDGVPPRAAAEALAMARVTEAMSYRATVPRSRR